ncbi:MAG: hypothetical protein IKA71_00785 [Lentisphaeria bacterium]|nr:hypothetical protein [Lentisphaeria bacterium]
MKRILTLLLSLPLLLTAQSIDVLASLRGADGKLMDGAAGSWEKTGETVKFTKTNSTGYIIYAGVSRFDPKIEPGKFYKASAEFEISGNASGALMISMPGGKRRPFPIKKLDKSGKAVINFTARPDEKQVHFHAVIKGQGEVTLKSMTLKKIDPDNVNLLDSINGSASNKEGAEGKAVFSNGKLVINKTNAAGYILFGGNHKNDLPIVPGQNYQVTANLEISGNASGALMISMPGSKRRPFPIKKIDKSGAAVINFTARPDENKLRIHIVARGQGKVSCDSVTLKNFSAASDSGSLLVGMGDKVAFLGDSITQAGNRSAGYINLVVSGFEANGINITKIPAGVSGNKSNQMLARLKTSVLDKNPQVMVLSCGVNDVWHGARGVKLEDYKRNITAIVDQTRAAGIKVVILTATMIREDANNDFNTKLAAYNDFLRRLAKEKACVLVDLNREMQQEIAAFKAKYGNMNNILTVDGVHMNVAGNMMMAKNILKGFGFNEQQIANAQKKWLELQFPLNDNIYLTVDDYCRLTRQAAENGKTFPEYVSELLKNAIR